MRQSPPLIAVAIVLTLTGCATVPEVSAQRHLAADTPWPSLVPTRDILAAAESGRLTEADTSALQARAAALRSRAAALRRRGI